MRRTTGRCTLVMIAVLGAAPSSRAQCGTVTGNDLATPALALGDLFGESVRSDGLHAIAGAHARDALALEGGSAWIWRWNGTDWIERQDLLVGDADGTDAGDNFGRAVDVDGDWAIAGSDNDDDGGNNRGSAHVFHLEGGAWTWKQQLLGSSSANQDHFGRALALHGEYAAVGAPFDDDTGTNNGSAFLFRRDASGVWTETQKLLPFDHPGVEDRFGKAFAMTERRVIVGASLESYTTPEGGAAYVWQDDGDPLTPWTLDARLEPQDGWTPTPFERFGVSVAMDGADGAELAVVGSLDYDANPTDAIAGTGAAYVFRRSASGWTCEGRLIGADSAPGDSFGWTVAVSGEVVVVGALFHDEPGAMGAGAAYVFRRVGGAWTQTQRLLAPSPLDAQEEFGHSIALHGERALFGAHGWNDDRGRVVTYTIHDECVLATCIADGSTTACPCANDVAVGTVAGCRNSLGVGATLSSSGAASIASDTLVLHGASMPDSSALYVQGSALASAVFGDGLRCAGGAVVRLGQELNAAGASIHPAGLDVAISVRGACAAGDVRIYQCWYRNAAAYCTPSTFDLTNALRVVWRA